MKSLVIIIVLMASVAWAGTYEDWMDRYNSKPDAVVTDTDTVQRIEALEKRQKQYEQQREAEREQRWFDDNMRRIKESYERNSTDAAIRDAERKAEWNRRFGN